MWKALVCLAAFALPLPAMAAGSMACSKRDDVLSQLGSKYKEAPSAVGLANNGGLIEVLTSDDGSTWTIIVSMPNGTSCLLAAGENWQPIERVAQGPQI
ncbi:MAG: hypothetical protein AB7S71_12160 [Dongiaceae bacterium]|jgi:hypothetical protein